MQRDAENINVDIDAFRRSGWKSAIGTAGHAGYPDMWRSLSAAAHAAIENGQVSEGRALGLLADACSMILRSKSMNEPFRPYMVVDDKRSALPDDFPQPTVALFATIAEEVDDVWLRARLADLVWLLQTPRSYRHALIAVDAYRAISLDTETWVGGGRECWQRAITLSRLLGAGAGERLKEIEAEVIAALEAAPLEDGFFALGLSDLLLDNHLGKDKAPDIASRLEAVARNSDVARNLHRARMYFGASGKWYRIAGNQAKVSEVTVCVAEEWVREAAAQLESDRPSYMVAASFYENAIQTYRTIPRAGRPIHRVDERVGAIHRLMSDAGEGSLDEMRTISSGPINITDFIEDARRAVRGKTALDALAGVANVYGGANVASLRKLAEDLLRDQPLEWLFGTTYLSRDGRVVAKRPAMSLEVESDEYLASLRAATIRFYRMEVSLAVEGSIWPALEFMLCEHRLREGDFVAIALRSPVVPKNRAGLFGKALFAGYERDFVSALHLLVPQIEHMVRWHLKVAGVKTTNVDFYGIENENGLSALMELSEVEQIFGEDLAFELKALFCDAFGPNLRNELAHGLLDEAGCRSVYAIYAWCLGLRMVFNTFWNTLRRPDAECDGAGDAEGGREQTP